MQFTPLFNFLLRIYSETVRKTEKRESRIAYFCAKWRLRMIAQSATFLRKNVAQRKQKFSLSFAKIAPKFLRMETLILMYGGLLWVEWNHISLEFEMLLILNLLSHCNIWTNILHTEYTNKHTGVSTKYKILWRSETKRFVVPEVSSFEGITKKCIGQMHNHYYFLFLVISVGVKPY